MKRSNCTYFHLLGLLFLFLLARLDFCWAFDDFNDAGQEPRWEEEDEQPHLDVISLDSPPLLLAFKEAITQIDDARNNHGRTTTTPSSSSGKEQSQLKLHRLRGQPQMVRNEEEHRIDRGGTTASMLVATSPVTSRSTTTSRRHDIDLHNKLINSNSNSGRALLPTIRSSLGYQYPQPQQRQTVAASYQQPQQRRVQDPWRRMIQTNDYRTIDDDFSTSTTTTTTTEAEDGYLSTSTTTSEAERAYLSGIVHVENADDNDHDDNDESSTVLQHAARIPEEASPETVVNEEPWHSGHVLEEDNVYGVVQVDDNRNKDPPLHGIVYAEDYAASKSMSTTHENTFVDGFGHVTVHAHLDTSTTHRGPWEQDDDDDELYGIVHVESDTNVITETATSSSSTSTSSSDASIGPWAPHDVAPYEIDTMEDEQEWEAYFPWGIEIEAVMSMPLTFAPSPGLPATTPPTAFLEPSLAPTSRVPSHRPTTASPTRAETASPTDVPTDSPSMTETLSPTQLPIATPSQAPITKSTMNPTSRPSELPRAVPTASPVVSRTPRPTTSRPTMDISRLRSLIESKYPIGGVRFNIDNPGFYQTMAFSWLKEDQQAAPLDDDRRIIQRYALACIYYATNGVGNDITDGLFGPGNVRSWINETGWLTEDSECTWFGVDLCSDDDTVLSFVMVANQMSGVLPSETGFLSNLQTLVVSGNFINNVGPVGHDWLAELSHLKVLDYSENGFFFDGIPMSLYELTSLEIYDCSRNYYFGEIQTFDFPPSLQVVRVADNDFAGSLSWMSRLPSLIEVDVSNNAEIVGPLPDTFNARLRIFSAGKCAITGSIPDGIVAALSLEIFSAPDNKLSGGLEIFAKLSKLRILDLHDNSFDGQIPAALGQLGSLETLRLDSNDILGAMPEEICMLRDGQLEVLGADCLGDNVISVPCDCCTCCSTLLCDFTDEGLGVPASLGSPHAQVVP
jgi:hypothetical protein